MPNDRAGSFLHGMFHAGRGRVLGVALSLPLVAATTVAPARCGLDGLSALSRRIPRWTGVVLVAVGPWSISFALYLPDAALTG